MNFLNGPDFILSIGFLVVTFELDLCGAKSNKLDTGIVNLLKINLELLLVKILRYTQLQENRELERMKQLLFHYYKYNRTANMSEIYRWTPMEDFDMFTGTPDFCIKEVLRAIRHNDLVKYKKSWKAHRRNHSQVWREYLKKSARKLPHVNASLVRAVLDEIKQVTLPANPYAHLFYTSPSTRRRRTPPKNYLRYVSFCKRTPNRNRTKTTAHMCEHC